MRKIYLIFALVLILSACSNEEVKEVKIKETQQDLEMISAYREANLALKEGDPYFAAKNF